MSSSNDALVELARSLAAVLQTFADGASHTAQPAHDPDMHVGQRPPRPADEHALGKRQLQIVELPGMATDAGMKTADVAAAIEYELPNTYTALQALARSQVVELVSGKEPQHWRLVRRYREGSRVFAQLTAVLQPGEWTTAADLSIAARGDVHAAEPDAREQLAAEGVAFGDDGRADPRQRVSWDELARRAAATQERRRSMAKKAVLNYIQIPAVDLEASITFYEQVLGWTVKRHPAVGQVLDQTGYPEFTDSTGRAGGGFVLGRPPSREPGLMPCIAVDSIDEILAGVVAHGGEVVKPKTPIVEGADWEAVFRDPAGNAFGLYEARDG